jgi:hypothetical protein
MVSRSTVDEHRELCGSWSGPGTSRRLAMSLGPLPWISIQRASLPVPPRGMVAPRDIVRIARRNARLASIGDPVVDGPEGSRSIHAGTWWQDSNRRGADRVLRVDAVYHQDDRDRVDTMSAVSALHRRRWSAARPGWDPTAWSGPTPWWRATPTSEREPRYAPMPSSSASPRSARTTPCTRARSWGDEPQDLAFDGADTRLRIGRVTGSGRPPPSTVRPSPATRPLSAPAAS